MRSALYFILVPRKTYFKPSWFINYQDPWFWSYTFLLLLVICQVLGMNLTIFCPVVVVVKAILKAFISLFSPNVIHGLTGISWHSGFTTVLKCENHGDLRQAPFLSEVQQQAQFLMEKLRNQKSPPQPQRPLLLVISLLFSYYWILFLVFLIAGFLWSECRFHDVGACILRKFGYFPTWLCKPIMVDPELWVGNTRLRQRSLTPEESPQINF